MQDRADAAHAKTESLLTALESRLRRLYRRTNKQLQKDLSPLLDEIYLDREGATQKQRLDYAEKHGKAEVAETVVNALLDANEKTVHEINQVSMEYYRLNVRAAADEIISQIKASMDGD